MQHSGCKTRNNALIPKRLPVKSLSVIGLMSRINGLVSKRHVRNFEWHVQGLTAQRARFSLAKCLQIAHLVRDLAGEFYPGSLHQIPGGKEIPLQANKTCGDSDLK